MSVAEKLVTVAENVPKVYEAGQNSIIDMFTNYGTRTDYKYGFSATDFTGFDFKGTVKPTAIGYMFWDYEGKELPSGIDLSGISVTSVYSGEYLFTYSALEIIYDMGLSPLMKMTGTYGHSWSLKTIEIVRVNESTQYSSTFTNNVALENLVIEGTIGQSGFNVSYSTNLTVASLLSILTALSKDSAAASGKSITFATAHQSVIEGDAQCLEQLNLAVNAGWTIAYA